MKKFSEWAMARTGGAGGVFGYPADEATLIFTAGRRRWLDGQPSVPAPMQATEAKPWKSPLNTDLDLKDPFA